MRLALTVVASIALLVLSGGVERLRAIEGREATYEWAADAPWRMEPTMTPDSGGARQTYGPIPIQIAIHDNDLRGIDPTYATLANTNAPCHERTPIGCQYSIRRLGQVRSVTVTELPSRASRTYTVADAHEVEFTTGHWPVQGPAPGYTLCRHWAGEDCSAFGKVAGTSEWHATLLHRPLSNVAAGADLRLQIEIRVSQVNLADGPGLPDATLTQQLNVHFGEAPLPRFDMNWAYGDLHYHSQGTDNEGESAHSHRGVLHAMGALGLDFTFATEHASGGEQITSVSELPIGFSYEGVLRDSNALRFRWLLAHLNGRRGANVDAASSMLAGAPPVRRMPQLFLGGEIDVIPETKTGEYTIKYGNNLQYSVDSCAYDIEVFARLAGAEGCPAPELYRGLVHHYGDGRWGIKDLQGPASPRYFARQHALHLPFDPMRSDAFVSSSTSKFGGATRRLRDVLASDYDAGQKGVLFLAHPLAHASGTGLGRMAGPDIVPYSEVQLDEAFASPHVLGLQLWNEDERMDSHGAVTGMAGIQGAVNPFTGTSAPIWRRRPQVPVLVPTLQHSTFAWDKLLRKGISEPAIRALRWLPAGQPRRVLMAGGSDAHGDLNYRRQGYMVQELSAIADTAIGKPRNLVFAGPPRGISPAPNVATAPFTQRQIVGALQEGHFSVTDGPAVRIAWDVNRNNAIDPRDVPMGSQLELNGTSATLLVEWLSTPEFGNVRHIDLYIGVRNEELGLDATYAPESHGVLQLNSGGGYPARHAAGPGFRSFRDSRTGRRVGRFADSYWFAQDGPALRIPVQSMSGTRSVTIDLDQFPVGVMNAATGTFDRPRRADRLYVRAFAVTTGSPRATCDVDARSECLERFAFTNPVWARGNSSQIVGLDNSGQIVGLGGKCLDVRDGSTTNGAPLIIGTCNDDTPSQRFAWQPATQEIAGIGLNKRVDLLGANPSEGAVVGMWDHTGAEIQKWTFSSAEIRPFAGFALDVDVTGPFEGANVQIVDSNSSASNQRWELMPSGEIRGYRGRCLDVYGWGTAEGTPVRVYTCHGGTNQKWSLEPNGHIRGFGGACLAADRPVGGTPGRVVMRNCSAPSTRGWAFFAEIRGWGGKCLDVYANDTTDGTPVLAYTCHRGANQKWLYRW